MQRQRIEVQGALSNSMRARQVSSMFDAPPEEKAHLVWDIEHDINDGAPWQVGLVVGPSGSGKTTVMRELWGEPAPLAWPGIGVVDGFDQKLSVEDIAAVCQAVGFNTIPAWMRPFAVLSNGEKFRAELARRLLEDGDPIVFDEFTSVVDRQVAKIGSNAVQKYIRRQPGKRFVAVTCHYDVADWLQPDWVLDMATRQFSRRLLQRRPELQCSIGRLPRSAWSLFAPFHYMTADLHVAAQCFGLWCEGSLAAFCAVLNVPVSQGKHKGEGIRRVSRAVTLPDYQGLGLIFVLLEKMGAEHAAKGLRFRTYPAHPPFIRAFDRSKLWTLKKEPGLVSRGTSGTGMQALQKAGRQCAVFEYVGPAAEKCTVL